MTVHPKNPKNKITLAEQKRLGEFLLKRLIECGWEDELGLLYQKIVEENEGREIPNETLMKELNERAPLVPEEIKMELLEQIVQSRGGGPYILNVSNTQKGLQLMFKGVELENSGAIDVFVRVNVKKVPASSLE